MTASYLAFMWPLGAGWGWVGVFWPPIFTITLLIVLFLRVKKGLPKNWGPKRWSGPFFATGINIILSGFFVLAATNYLTAKNYSGEAIELDFPLRGGTFLISHGGANKGVNYHFPVKAQRYALDIVELNSFGTRAMGLLPDAPENYQIFGNDVIAPCAGEIISARDDLKDQTAMTMDPENLVGNNIILFCQGHSVLLAHLKQESLLVDVGDMVIKGQLIALVGNTGNTSEPHLHIHAVLGRHSETKVIAFEQQGVPIIFNGDFLIRNDRVIN